MNEAQARKILTRFAGLKAPTLKIVDSAWSRGRPVKYFAAYTPHNDRITVTKALLADFANDGELAFMLAHELGHRALKHGFWDMMFKAQAAELAADAYAVKVMRLYDYDVKAVLWWFDRRIAFYKGANRRKMAARRAAVGAIIAT